MVAKKIVIVDDEPGFLRMLTLRMNLEGFETVGINSAFEALDKISSSRPDLVVIDRRLKDIDGIEFAGRLKGLYPTLPVIIVSALASTVPVPDTRFDVIHSKPLDWEIFMRDVKRIIFSEGTGGIQR